MCHQDHPRRCGENWLSDLWGGIKNGSPPQVRGKLCGFSALSCSTRITPAGAGKTATGSIRSGTPRDHPRRCGENAYQVGFALDAVGSPPQVRGKLDDIPAKQRERRITPAGAGKTLTHFFMLLPRIGSPPQVRGKHRRSADEIADDRITPAGAGKTQTKKHFTLSTTDHPRRCGENKSAHGRLASLKGSPPQVRGKLSRWAVCRFLCRITPAGAGKTQHQNQRRQNHGDHPRRCGENWQKRWVDPRKKGSPPQVRGKRFICDRSISHERITPAGAGKTEEIKQNGDFY